MQTPPYAFMRDGQPVAHLNSNGSFSSNADGAGWYEYDSFAEFLDESGITPDPLNYVAQLAAVVNATPQINMAALATAPAAAAVEQAPAAVAPKPKRGRKRADGTAPAVEVAPATPAPVHVDPAPAPTADPAYLAFLKSQKEAADKLRGAAPEQPVQVTAPDTYPAPVVTAPAPAGPLPGGTAPTAPTAKPLGNPAAFASQINALIETHGYSAVVDCVLDWSVQRLAVAVQQLHTLRSVSTGL